MVLEPSRSQHDTPYPGSRSCATSERQQCQQPCAGGAVSTFRTGHARLEQVRDDTVFLGAFRHFVVNDAFCTCGQLHGCIDFGFPRHGTKWSFVIHAAHAVSTSGTLRSGGHSGSRRTRCHSIFR
jgi:hypothetical protein